MNRRRLLTALPTAFTILSTGCLQATRNSGSPQGTETLPTRLWLEQVSLSESERESVDPIVYGKLSGAEQEIVRVARVGDRDRPADPDRSPNSQPRASEPGPRPSRLRPA
jgi:hypothetical protein